MKSKLLLLLLLVLITGCNSNRTEELKEYQSDIIETIEVVDLTDSTGDQSRAYKEQLIPVKKKDGAKFRVAIIQSGEYYGYSHMLKGIVEGLSTLGWIKENITFDDTLPMPEIIIKLSDPEISEYLIFSNEAYFDFNWEEPTKISPKLHNILSGEKADIIISLGTTSALIVSQSKLLKIPVIAENVSDPIGSGLIKSYEDSGNILLSASCDPEQDSRQFKLFHSVIKFKKLGIIYTDTPLGRSYGAVDAAEKLSKQLGFELVTSTDVIEDPTDENFALAEKKYINAVKKIAPDIDALYLGIQGGLTPDILPALLKIIKQYKIPTFAMEGSDFVSNGILLGESESNVISVGIYNAKKIVTILKGEKAGSLNQIFEHVPHIAINLKAAELINYDVPIDIIASSDEIYQTIGGK
ncbi:MAG: hypothetical protein A2015_15220 [Spirochaetes bacterium GWF1_31_7]|nr:MAG: hypothetical protein A2Y30_11645 [Spirochaetes bacterium GWE1_32_154]OHD51171.1 MAG: hypothetical protein A2Y29_01185 [Spirochaetes bacterium GWE2_31_10]OHD52090.1 MAG: hypothetical protein A2015_15220 [Spirochaetes bacterium GWF1_31_7]HBD93263.1 hypothetical protein [Spirochaetia bacterium]